MSAYTTLIQALHHMNWDLDISIKGELRGDNEDTDYKKEWDAKHRAAWEEVRKQIDVGEFLYSAQSVEILRELNNTTKHQENDTYFDYLEKTQIAVAKCLPAIKSSARADLGLPNIRQKILGLFSF